MHAHIKMTYNNLSIFSLSIIFSFFFSIPYSKNKAYKIHKTIPMSFKGTNRENNRIDFGKINVHIEYCTFYYVNKIFLKENFLKRTLLF